MTLLRLIPIIVLLALAAPALAQQEDAGADETTTEAAAAVHTDPTAEDEKENEEGIVYLVEAMLGPIFEHTAYWAWFWLLGMIVLGVIGGKIAQMALRGASERLIGRGWEFRGLVFRDAASPLSLAIFTICLRFGLVPIYTAPIAIFESRVLQFLFTLAIAWFIFNLVDIVDLGLRRVARADTNKLAGQLVPLIRKALRIFIAVVFTLFVAQNVFDVNITAWLAGLGIAGLAVSLAGQDSIKNLFGSITVLLDKPFAVGDRVVFGEVDGFVEEIGFRSTKIRTFTGHLITVPNMKFIDSNVENVSARPFLRRTMNVTITYDTPPEKIDQAVQIIKEILAEDEFASAFKLDERPPRVYFNDFNSDSLNISVAYWYFLAPESALGTGDARDWWSYQVHAEKFNHRLFRAYADAGIDFAFPTQTLYLAGDPDRQLSVRLLNSETSGDRA